MLHIEKVKYIKDYKLNLVFNDGTVGTVDLENTIKNDKREIVYSLISLDLFKKFSISHHTVSWENGLDFAPEFLYSKIK